MKLNRMTVEKQMKVLALLLAKKKKRDSRDKKKKNQPAEFPCALCGKSTTPFNVLFFGPDRGFAVTHEECPAATPDSEHIDFRTTPGPADGVPYRSPYACRRGCYHG